MNAAAARFSIRLALAALAAASFASCTVYDDRYYAEGPNYGGGYVASGGGYYDGGYAGGEWYDDYYDFHPPIYRSYVTYGAAWPHFYGGRYYSYAWWNDNRYRNYCHDHGSNHSRYSKRRSGEEMKLVRYRGDDRGRLPTGYHSQQWYKDRGYSLKNNTYREKDGDLRGRQPSSSSNSRDRDNNRGSSSSSRQRDDDRPTSEHPRAIRQPDKYRYTGSGGSSNRDSERHSSSSNSNRDSERRSSNYSNSSSNRRDSSSSSSSSSGRSQNDKRPTSEHPRAIQQPDKYRYTGGGGEKKSSSERGGSNRGSDDKNKGKGKKD